MKVHMLIEHPDARQP